MSSSGHRAQKLRELLKRVEETSGIPADDPAMVELTHAVVSRIAALETNDALPTEDHAKGK